MRAGPGRDASHVAAGGEPGPGGRLVFRGPAAWRVALGWAVALALAAPAAALLRAVRAVATAVCGGLGPRRGGGGGKGLADGRRTGKEDGRAVSDARRDKAGMAPAPGGRGGPWAAWWVAAWAWAWAWRMAAAASAALRRAAASWALPMGLPRQVGAWARRLLGAWTGPDAGS